MKYVLFISATLVVLSASPSLAREYPVCSRISGYGQGGILRCDFASIPQCQATVSGQAGDCIPNPKMTRRY